MAEPTIENVLKRLEHVERENRYLKRIGAVMLIGIAAVAIMGQARPSKVAKVIEAEQFVVRDRDGKVRAILGETKSKLSGDPQHGLFLYGKDGQSEAYLAEILSERLSAEVSDLGAGLGCSICARRKDSQNCLRVGYGSTGLTGVLTITRNVHSPNWSV